ncbi:hypothetical protein AK830_g9555 [Neonectria ditissima]|uniref:SP-RING-type domain-containing protein n=1 Tax=Neonectria ditissima TaxID=78410 RepID=A0A0P7B9I3_9HYPO|nr:hypothetical protein AK830_g9555 [Neonectria ditissima]
MPQSPEQPQPRANPVHQAAQIATSNKTLNTFLGGRHRSWMTEAFPTTNVIRTSEIAPRKRPRLTNDSAPLRALSTNDGNAQRREGFPVNQYLDQSGASDASRSRVVLPSPAPTDEPSPVISSHTDSPNHASSGYADITAPPQSAATDNFSRGGIAPTPSTALNARTAEHLQQASAASSPRSITNMAEQAMASASGSGAAAQEATGLQPSSAGRNVTSPQVGQRTDVPDPRAAERLPRRKRPPPLDDRAQVNKGWLQAVAARIAQFEDPGLLNDVVEIPRFKLLREACATQDIFYIVLHQVFCEWSLNKNVVYTVLHPHVSSEAIDQSFQILQTVLRKNDMMAPIHIEWFAMFPGAPHDLPRSSPQSGVIPNVAHFLNQLAHFWEAMVRSTQNRKFPFLVYEMVMNFGCTSPSLQSLLFTTSRRMLGVVDGPCAMALNDVFNKDKSSERRIDTGQFRAEDVTQIRMGFGSKYADIVQHFRQQQQQQQQPPSTQNSAASSPTITSTTGGRQQNHPRLLPRPSPILSHPHAISPSMTAAPSPVFTHLDVQMAARRASGPEYLGSLGSRGDLNARTSNVPTDGRGYATSEFVVDRPPQIFGNPATHVPQPFTPVSGGAVSPSLRSPYTTQDMSQNQALSSNGPTQNMQRRATSFQQQSTQAPPSQGLQFPQYIQQQQFAPVINPLLSNSSQPNQARATQNQSAPQPWPQSVPIAGGYGPQSPALRQPAQRVYPSYFAPGPPSARLPPGGYPANPPGFMIPARTEIHPNEYAVSSYGQHSLEVGLHQVRLRSPRRLPTWQLARNRYYQYVKETPFGPVAIHPQAMLLNFSFHVPEDHFEKLTMQKETPGLPFCHYYEGSYRYRLRLCMRPAQETEVDAADWAVSPCHWPKHVFVDVNDHMMELRRKQHFHKDLPIELTDVLVPGRNHIRISLPLVSDNVVPGNKYFIAVELVETRSHDSLKARIEKMQRTSVDETRQKMIRRLRPPSDSDDVIIEDETLQVSLADPFSSSMFEIPVRGAKCLHLECFDLETWLQTRPSKPPQKGGGEFQKGPEPSMVDTWKCPICDLDARPLSLRIDEYFIRVRNELVAGGMMNTKAITVTADGQWTPVSEPDDSDDETPVPNERILANGDREKSKSVPSGAIIEIVDD